MKKVFWWGLVCCTLFCCHGLLLGQQDQQPDTKGDKGSSTKPGHSSHGEIFNEGPRQKAYLMEGMAKIKFPVSSEIPEVQKFVEQGICQLHGYWYFEAERSFRHAAKLDPTCAIAYWGMAMANEENGKRAKGFIKEAIKHKGSASKREKMYIEAFNDYLNASGPAASKKSQNIIKAHEEIAKEFPDDLEAKAFLANYLQKFRGNVKKSYEDVEAVIQSVLAEEPLHPVHHYQIHLWDYKDSKRALKSSALGGPSAPGVAHLWHMPGHIYSNLKRYEDAIWQQEAATRVDHKYMMKNLVLPDQIHNYAHNEEWFIRNLMHAGKHKDALLLAKNLIEIPRHPKYNTIAGRKSGFYGRLRLFEVLARFELWQQTIALAETPYMVEVGANDADQIKRLRYLGIAHARLGKFTAAEKVLAELDQRLAKDKATPIKEEKPALSSSKTTAGKASAQEKKTEAANKQPADQKDGQAKSITDAKLPPVKLADTKTVTGKSKAMPPAKKPVSPNKQPIENAIAAIKGHWAYMVGDYKQALELMRKSGEDALIIARTQSLAGDTKGAIAAVQGQVKSQDKQVVPLATLVEVLWHADKKKEAGDAFKQLRDLSSSIQFGAPVFDRLAPISRELGLPEDWRIKAKLAADIGPRPDLNDLGPFCWQPTMAAKWTLLDSEGKSHSLDQYKGKPVVVLFYLGYGCLHCTEQLQAFGNMTEQFKKSGISLVAISTDDQDGLKVALKACKDGKFAFPLLSNAKLDVFKSYRAFDDFEDIPLHATCLIDGMGMVRWIDISFEPFMNAQFVLEESRRLLSFDSIDCCNE